MFNGPHISQIHRWEGHGWFTRIFGRANKSEHLLEWQIVRNARMCTMIESVMAGFVLQTSIPQIQLQRTWGNVSCLSRKVWLITGTALAQDLHTLFSRRRSLFFGWNIFVLIWASQAAMIECFSNSESSSWRTQGNWINWAGIHG